ncbi:thioredoxin family protein [Patiriisocius marinus]|uniref:Thioredoxin n=1 Tax=Patiriisocius marinus TaxID=1397112 RepID=A0A5J4IR15_9FLAO|nr:thioredoxin family protein [Patiriisocius marinus]GER60355.1 thioredoxin [Patiriisocius marinus]
MKAETITTESTALIEKTLNASTTYQEYRDLVHDLAQKDLSTGPIQTEALANYTGLNNARMRRLDKTIKISEETQTLFTNYSKSVTWLVLTESWCGDAAQSMPVINKLANIAPHVEMKVALRDENVELMQHFLTNGGMSIPKLIAIDNASKVVLGEWGPRPTVATKMVADYKEAHGGLTPEFKQDLQVWYTRDKGQSIIDDLEKILL